MKIIKIIDLYRKIVMKEELPKKVKHKNKIYILDNEIEQNPYTCKENGNWKTYLIGATLYDCPTDEVEIIEEDKDIEKLKIEQDGSTYYIKNEHGTKCYLTKHSYLIADKVNELIGELSKLKG